MSEQARRICQNIARTIRYQAEPARTDFWQPPAVTESKRKGDCEDFAILVLDKCRKAGIPCKMFITYSGYQIGHAIVIGDDGQWYANNAYYFRCARKDVAVHLAKYMRWKVRPFLLEVTNKMLRGRGIKL